MGDFRGIGVLKATGISVELDSNDSQRSKAGLFDAILDYVKNEIKIEAKKNQLLNAIDFTQNGIPKSVLIRSISSGYRGYSLARSFTGEVLFFDYSDTGIEIGGRKYRIYLMGASVYQTLKADNTSGKISGSALGSNTTELDEEVFRNYFKPEGR